MLALVVLFVDVPNALQGLFCSVAIKYADCNYIIFAFLCVGKCETRIS